MNKSKFNYLPPLKKTEYRQLRLSIKKDGFNSGFPIITYKDDILDGWHRHLICEELGIAPLYSELQGSDNDAVELFSSSSSCSGCGNVKGLVSWLTVQKLSNRTSSLIFRLLMVFCSAVLSSRFLTCSISSANFVSL